MLKVSDAVCLMLLAKYSDSMLFTRFVHFYRCSCISAVEALDLPLILVSCADYVSPPPETAKFYEMSRY
jgi:hypothetical protein